MRIQTEKSVLQLCRLCKQREAEKEWKVNLDWNLCGKCQAMSIDAESLCCCEKNEISHESLNGNFLRFWLYNTNFMHREAGIQCSE